MWFLFGIITLISFSICGGYRRLNATWLGRSVSSKGISFQYKVIIIRRRKTRLLVGIDGSEGFDYAFR